MAPDMTKDEIDQLTADRLAARQPPEPVKQQNGKAGTVEAQIDAFLGPVTAVVVNGTSASLMAFLPLDRVMTRLAFLLGRTLGAGMQAADLPTMFRYRAEIKKQFEAGLASVPASVAVAGGAAQQAPRPPG